MSANLQLVFSRDKSRRTLSITEPSSELTKAQVLAAMEKLIAHQAILTKNQPVDTAKDAYLSEVIITELEAA